MLLTRNNDCNKPRRPQFNQQMVPHDLKDNKKNFINDFPSGGILFIKLPQGVHACMSAHSVTADSATPRTLAHQAHLLMGFPGKNTGVICHFLLSGLFPTQGSNLHLLLGRRILYHSAPWEAPPQRQCGLMKKAWHQSLISLSSNTPFGMVLPLT